MIQAAGLGVAYRAKPGAAAASRHRIQHGDLRGLLYAQGNKAGEFVAIYTYLRMESASRAAPYQDMEFPKI